MSDECPLCNIPYDPAEKILERGDTYFICETKDKKRHKQRVMIVTTSHGPICRKEQERLHTTFEIFCRYHFTSPTVCILQDRHSSISGHFHIVASDWKGNDIKQMHDTPHICIETEAYERARK